MTAGPPLGSRLRLRQSPALPQGFSHDDQPLDGRLYLMPAGIVSGDAAASALVGGNGWSLAGGALVFTACVVALRHDGYVIEALAPFAEVLDWSAAEGEATAAYVGHWLQRLGGRRAAFAGWPMERPAIMAVLNVTPDSFSDGGRYVAAEAAVAAGLAMAEAGAAIIDVGGESTRPGAAAVGEAEEVARIVPVVRALAERGLTVSIDTRHAAVMEAALAAGAAIINDVSGLQGPGALKVAACSGAPVVLMHMRGEPGTMQEAPVYGFAPLDVYDHLAARVRACLAAGVAPNCLCVDPGIGFGKTVEHNLQILSRLGLYHGLGCPVVLGASRKSFIGRLSRGEAPDQRLAGSLAAALAGLDQGAQILRVHDVAETSQAVAVWKALRSVPAAEFS